MSRPAYPVRKPEGDFISKWQKLERLCGQQFTKLLIDYLPKQNNRQKAAIEQTIHEVLQEIDNISDAQHRQQAKKTLKKFEQAAKNQATKHKLNK